MNVINNKHKPNFKQLDMPNCCMNCAFSVASNGPFTQKALIACTGPPTYDSIDSHSHVFYDDVMWNYICDDHSLKEEK